MRKYNIRFNIDALKFCSEASTVGEGYLFLVAWAFCVDPEEHSTIVPALEIKVESYSGVQKVYSVTANTVRRDVVNAHPKANEICGFDFVLPMPFLPRQTTMNFRVGTTLVHNFEMPVHLKSIHATGSDITRSPIINVRFYTDFPVCNFRCPYCVAGHGEAQAADLAWDEGRFERFDRIIENLTRLPMKLNVRPGVGGEFFLSKRLVEGAKRLVSADNINSVNLITNLSIPLIQYQHFLTDVDPKKIAIVASYHPTEIRNQEAWLDTALWVNERVDFAVILVGYPPLIPQLPAVLDRLNGLGITVFIQGFIGSYDGRKFPQQYSLEEKQSLRKLCYSRHDYEFFIEARKPGFCLAGYNSFYVDMSGVVRACGVGGWPWPFMGNISENPQVTLLPGPHPCINDTCLCDTEYINTAIFAEYYKHTGLNQHKYTYKFKELAARFPQLDEWNIPYL